MIQVMIDWIKENLNLICQVIATGLVAALFIYLYRWYKKDKRERQKREQVLKKRAWEREIERAGRRMIEADRREYIRRTTQIVKSKSIKVYAFGPYAQYAEAWKNEGGKNETAASKTS